MSVETSPRWPAAQDLSPTVTATVLLGVDVVDVARVRRGVVLHGDSYERHLCSSAEQDPLADDESPETALAARLAVKECAIKAMGRRPPGFTWRDIEVNPQAETPSDPASVADTGPLRKVTVPAADVLASVLGRATDLLVRHRATVRVTGASADALSDLLACAPEEIDVTAAWGAGRDVVVAVAAIHARHARPVPWEPPPTWGEDRAAAASPSTTDVQGGTAR